MLVIDNLRKSFGSVQALNGMSYSVNPGELFGFVGSNGAGKTTCMRIILGVLAKDSGSVTWNGQDLDFATRQRIGYMPEERGLYPKMKVGDQLVYLARLHGIDAGAATKAMEAWTERLGLGHRRDDNVQALSLGNQQRVQLAAALIADPEILVLDEPFSGLDPVAVDVMSDVMREKVKTGVPVVFSSHQLDLVERLCDRVGIVSHGKTIAEGTIDSLRETDTPEFFVVTDTDISETLRGSGADVLSAVPDDGRVRHLVRTGNGMDQQILHAALSAGPVHEFKVNKPHLADLFRHAVTSDPAPEPVEEKPKKKSLFGRGRK